MPEIFLLLFVLGLILSPQILAGILAKSMGRNFWFWFGISFLLPFISLFILLSLKDKNPDKSIPLAEHVKNNVV